MAEELAERGSTAVGAATALPSPVYNPDDATAEDIALPRIKVGESQSDRVQDGDDPVNYGDIFTETSNDDSEPVVLAKAGKSVGDPTKPEILFFLLAPMRISYSWNDKETNEFIVAGPDDARLKAQHEAFGHKGKDKWIPRKGYNLLVSLPDQEPQMIYKLLLKGMSSSAYRHMDTELRKASQERPFWEVPFYLTAKKSKKDTYNFNVWQIKRADIADGKLGDYVAQVEALVNPAHDIFRSASAIDATEATVVPTDAPSID